MPASLGSGWGFNGRGGVIQRDIEGDIVVHVQPVLRIVLGGQGGWTGVGTHQDILQSPDTLYKAPTDYTKPRQIIHSPKIIQRHRMLDKNPTY